MTARSTGRRVEVLSERSRYERSWVNPDGSMAREQTGLVRFEDEAATGTGGWRDVNVTLEHQPDGSAKALATPQKLVVGGAGATDLVQLSDGEGRTLGMGAGLDGVRLPTPVLDGPVATYPEVLPGLDLRVEARPDGFEQLWVAKSREGLVALTAGQLLGGTGLAAKVRSERLSWSPQTDGSVDLADAVSGKTVGQFGVPSMWDGVVDRAVGEPRSVGRVKFELRSGGEVVSPGKSAKSGLELRVLPDVAWLNSPKRVFPVVVDPTYSAKSTAPILDTWVQESVTTDQSTHAELKLGVDGNGDVARTFINVNPVAVSGRQIMSASLDLSASYSGTCTAKGWSAYNSGAASSATRWTSQPTIGTKYATSTQTKGFSSSCPAGPVSIDMKAQLQRWADDPTTTRGLMLRADSETDAGGWKRFKSLNAASNPPVLRWTQNRIPPRPGMPLPAPHTTYDPDGAGSGPSYVYTADTTPAIKAPTGNDADGNTVRNEYAMFATSTATTNPIASCNTQYATAGGYATCSLPALPANSTGWLRGRSFDHMESSEWVTAREVRIAPSTPAVPVVACPAPYTNNSWASTPPAGSVACTVTATGTGFSAPSMIRYSVDNGPWTDTQITQSSSASVAKVNVSVANSSGGHSIRAYAATPPGTLSELASHSFGYGDTPSLQTPAAAPRVTTAGRLPITAEGQPQGGATAVTAKVRWRVAAGSTSGWVDAPAGAAPLTVTQAAGRSVVSGSFGVEALGGTADGSGTVVNDRIPTLVDVQVCLSYDSTVQCTPAATVLRVPHAIGAGFPRADAGPGQVALWTGELQVDDSDAAVTAPGGDLSVSRTHTSFGGVGTPQSGVFGPGWVASFEDGADGLGGAQVLDSTRVDGTLALVDADGSALVFTTPTGNRRTTADLPTGKWVPADEDTDLSGITATVTGSGAATAVEVTGDDGVVTKFGVRTAPTATTDATFKTLEVRDTAVAEKTTYGYDAAGRVTSIVAPLPDGVTSCVAGTPSAGCRVLKVSYATTTTATPSTLGDVINQVKEIRAQVNTDADKTLAAYLYDSTGRLVQATDVRTNLTTSYTWTGTGTSLRLATLTPSGQEPFTFTYDGDKLARVTRPNPASAGGGTAQLAGYVYDIPTTGTGLPDVRYNAADTTVGVSRWGQTTAPTWGAAVFGPDKPLTGTSPAAITNPADWAYADLQYTDPEGYTTNTASYGAGDWQLTATEYDTLGNPIRAWDERATRALVNGEIAAAHATDVATLTRYNDDITSGGTVVTPAGTLVTDTYGPVHDVVSAAGDLKPLRTHTATSYDQAAPNAGINPDTGQPYRLATKTLTTAETADGTADGSTPLSIALTGYDKVDPADPTSGWELGQATISTTDMNLSGTVDAGDIIKVTRYDGRGRIIETRQPKSNGTDSGTRTTTYYTAATTSNGCGSKPTYAGMLCQEGPAAQPGGQTMPTSKTTAYTWDGQAATSVGTSGAVTSTTATSFDATTNRPLTSGTTVTGLASSTPVPAVTTSYDLATGEVTGTSSTAGSTAMTYDSWGRQLTYTNTPTGQPADTSTTTYNPLGEVVSVVDNNGQTVYTYDGTDAAGQTERRGLTTSVKVKIAGGAEYTSTGGYDETGALTLEQLPGNINRRTSLDIAGDQTDYTYSGQMTEPDTGTITPDQPWFGWTTTSDPESQTAREWTPDTAAFTDDLTGADAIASDLTYTYDQADRLTKVQDRNGNTDGTTPVPCTTRTYTFDTNGNRTNQNSHPAAADGSCTTSTTGTPATRAYDTVDRPTTGANGTGTYVYDQLGRQTTIPAVDAPNPANGNITLGYYDTDAARAISQDGTTTTFTLDSANRRHAQTTTTGGSTTNTLVRHYTDAGDNPAWTLDTTSGTTTSTRYNELINGDLGLTLTTTGANTTAALALATPRGDNATTINLSPAMTGPGATSATGIDTWTSYAEYGQPRQPVSPAPGGTTGIGYGWLGGKQRGTVGAGLILMGARLYNPTTGLFTSVDSVQGGGDTRFGYPNNPVQVQDLNGKWWRVIYRVARYAVKRWGVRAWHSIRKGNNPYLRIGQGRVSHGNTRAHWKSTSGWRRQATRFHGHYGRSSSGKGYYFGVSYHTRKRSYHFGRGWGG